MMNVTIYILSVASKIINRVCSRVFCKYGCMTRASFNSHFAVTVTKQSLSSVRVTPGPVTVTLYYCVAVQAKLTPQLHSLTSPCTCSDSYGELSLIDYCCTDLFATTLQTYFWQCHRWTFIQCKLMFGYI